ncbi:general secretion pathway protein GspK [Noviherbaspirillum cavernae]|uniref:Type II secretion system protein K n=1 Tax=Noviherbaspirillum cavernae TaxID=2320862 RepID=A0A418WXD2_9BURK|nr:type II secretion system minor pseudopilin GspK [Noviherbaspirillum cavernae]RJG04908.1 general secretion pathway protein GspK [Noviherbaspirillum cavernae]
MKARPLLGLRRQRGVAVVTALLLTTLAITIVASLFWQQQVQVRSIENQRLQLQKQWILRGALDWSRLILREDARHSKVDHLGEPWAVTLAETRLDQYVENAGSSGDVPDAALSGSITDAQARLNLTNLCQGGKINPTEVEAFARLLTTLKQNPALAQATANLMASAQARTATGDSTATAPSAVGQSSPQPLNILQVDDLLAVPGFTPEALARIRDFIVVLPKATPVNVNTAPAEVLAARIDTLSLSEATALVAARNKAWFTDPSDFAQRSGKSGAGQIAVTTGYFLVNGNVRLNRAAMDMQSLIERSGTSTKVIWIREN